MKIVLFPTEGVEALFIRGSLPNGTPLEDTAEKFKIFEKYVFTNKGVSNKKISFLYF